MDIIFPHHNLFNNLTKQNSLLWTELRRLLRHNGSIQILFDTQDDKRYVSQRKYIHWPELLIETAAISNGFNSQSQILNEREVDQFGTIFSQKAVILGRQNNNVKVFRKLCIKH